MVSIGTGGVNFPVGRLLGPPQNGSSAKPRPSVNTGGSWVASASSDRIRLVDGRGRGTSSTAQRTLPPSAVGRPTDARERPATMLSTRPSRSGSENGWPSRAGPWSRTVRRRAPRFQTTDRSMSVPALIDELATSSLITKLAKGMTRPNRQSSRVRVTNSRDARGGRRVRGDVFPLNGQRRGRQNVGYRGEQ